MAIKINWKDLQKRIINGKEVEKVICDWVQIWPEGTPPVPVDDYLCFTAAESNSTVTLFWRWRNTAPASLEISYDKSNWEDYTLWNEITLSNVWDKIYRRNKSAVQTQFSTWGSDYYQYVFTWSIAWSWDVNYLLCKNSTTELSDYCFRSLFEGKYLYHDYRRHQPLISAPRLPATVMHSNCYQRMFLGCEITVAPELPATTLANECYADMFWDCAYLVTAPQLPATTMTKRCYWGMLAKCDSLVTAPQLPAMTLAYGCYEDMFNWCISLVTAPQLPAITLAEGCYAYMFQGCTSLVNAPRLPAETVIGWVFGSYANMFSGCTSLVNVPQMNIKYVGNLCCSWMFSWCTSLKTLPALPARSLSRYCYEDMFNWCSNIKLSTIQTAEYNIPYSIPYGASLSFGEYRCTYNMFSNTGWTFTWTPDLDTVYYTNNRIIAYTPLPWIYHNSSLWLISLSSDGTNWITIADKNLWATVVYNYWDTLSNANCGNLFQRWNCYGFPYIWTVQTWASLWDVNGYWPGNYYYDDTFRSSWGDWWFHESNPDLRWWRTDTKLARQWPCPSGYHIPSRQELDSINSVAGVFWWNLSGNNALAYLKIPPAWYRQGDGTLIQNNIARFWSSNTRNSWDSYGGYIEENGYTRFSHYFPPDNWNSIRPFKNDPVIPDNTWTILYQPQ